MEDAHRFRSLRQVDLAIDELPVIDTIGTDRNYSPLRTWYVLLGWSDIHGILRWFGPAFAQIDRPLDRSSRCPRFSLRSSHSSSGVQVSPSSSLFLCANHRQFGKSQSAQFALDPLSSAGLRPIHVSRRVTISFDYVRRYLLISLLRSHNYLHLQIDVQHNTNVNFYQN